MSKAKALVPKQAGKRAAPVTLPEDDVLGGAEGGVGNESDDDGAAGLKAAFMKQYKAKSQKAVPESRTIKSSGGSQPTVAVEGICIRVGTREQTNRRTGAKLPQIIADVVVTKVRANGAPDILQSGTPGFDFLLPTMKPPRDDDARDANDDSPDAPAGGQGGKTPQKKQAAPRTLQLPANHKTVAIGVGGVIQAAMFTLSGKGGGGDAKDKQKDGVDLIVAGMRVDVTGVVGGLSADGTMVYLNTSNIIPLADGLAPGHGPSEIINVLKGGDIHEGAALRLSMSMRGFFGDASGTSPHLDIQANHIRRRWNEARDGIVQSVEAKAMALRADPADGHEAMALVMDDHAARLRGTNPADLAGGAFFFNPAKVPTPDYPIFNAAIVHEIAGMDMPCPKAVLDFIEGGESRSALPEVFCVPTVTKCEFTPYNSVVIAHVKLDFVGSKSAAVAALSDITKTGGIFALDSVGAAVGIRVDLRTQLPPFTGIIGVAKGVDMAPDILKFGRWAVVTGVNPKEPTDYDVSAPFNDGWTLDMPATIRNIGVAVDEAFIKEHLCGGSNQFAFESDPNLQVFKIKNKADGSETAISAPQLKLHIDGYQELTSQTYKMATAKVPPDCTGKEYRVWYKGATDDIRDDTDLLDPSNGGRAVLAAAAAATTGDGSKMDPLDFLTERCAVYVLATK